MGEIELPSPEQLKGALSLLKDLPPTLVSMLLTLSTSNGLTKTALSNLYGYKHFKYLNRLDNLAPLVKRNHRMYLRKGKVVNLITYRVIGWLAEILIHVYNRYNFKGVVSMGVIVIGDLTERRRFKVLLIYEIEKIIKRKENK